MHDQWTRYGYRLSRINVNAGRKMCRQHHTGLRTSVFGLRSLVLFLLQATVAWGADGRDQKPFTIFALPDTQIYTEKLPHVFEGQTEWIVHQRAALNCKYVLHLGDIVNAATDEQFRVASKALATLDGRVPYCLAIGNRDMLVDTRDTSLFDKYFPATRFASQPGFAGQRENDNTNTFYFFRAGGLKFMILCLAFAPSDEELAWANETVAAHPDRRVIINTHSYITADPDGAQGQWTTEGAYVFEKFVRRHGNIFLVLCGHALVARRTDRGDRGNVIHALCADGYGRSMEGYIYILKFVPGQDRIKVTTWSTLYDQRHPDVESSFELVYSMQQSRQKTDD